MLTLFRFRWAFPSVAIGFLAGVAWARRRTAPGNRVVPVEPRPQRDVIDVPWVEE